MSVRENPCFISEGILQGVGETLIKGELMINFRDHFFAWPLLLTHFAVRLHRLGSWTAELDKKNIWPWRRLSTRVLYTLVTLNKLEPRVKTFLT